MIKLPDEQSRHQLPKLPNPVTAKDMKESLNIPMFQDEAECAASAFNQCLMECQPVYDAAKRINGALNECLKEMDGMQESINYKYKTLIKWRKRAIELEAEVQRLNATAQPVSHDLIPVPEEFLYADQNEKGLFELSEDCMCRLSVALSQQSKGLVISPDSVVVPKILTREMRHAWDSAPNANTDDDDLNMQRAYSSMLAAAPGGQDG